MQDRDPIAPATQKAYAWIGEVSETLGVPDRHRGYQALRSVLHALRDRLGVDEAAHLGAQLPLVVRGIYYEGWKPAGKPEKQRTREAFLEEIRSEVPGMLLDEAEIAAVAVFEVLQRHVGGGEVEDVKGVLPAEVRALWPAAA
ncbi:MAG: DUF2267 domain-containing protein [Chloroflexi bacterium]|nr:DUF2267 domain-containing protein [Chloroflexota bacterium]MDA1010984.1 DUF2267 domain-containing protein [Chloroflexota bacterium]